MWHVIVKPLGDFRQSVKVKYGPSKTVQEPNLHCYLGKPADVQFLVSANNHQSVNLKTLARSKMFCSVFLSLNKHKET